MILDSKNQLRTEVELFAKIFLSAEASNSFVDGVDKQITDRVNQIYKDTKLELKDREIFQEHDSSIYYNVVYNYVYKFFESTIKQYINLGKINASKRASKVLQEFHNIYKLEVELLDEKVKKVFWNTIFNIIDYIDDVENLNNLEREISKNIVIKIDQSNQEFYYIKSFKKVFEMIMKNEDEEFYKKARYKTSQVHVILGINKEEIGKVHWVNNKSIKAFKFSNKDIIEFQDENGNEFLYMPITEENAEIPF
jgi:hypothetical protein